MTIRFIALLITSLYCNQVYAEVSGNAVVAERGSIRLTLKDIDLVLEKVPVADRAGVVAGYDRLHHIIESELLNKQIAQRGREMKLMESPMVQQLVAREAEKAFAVITLDQIVKNAKRPDFSIVAREYYLANSSEFETPVTSVVQHILVSKDGRTAPEVLARTKEILTKARVPGADFGDLVNLYSDDSSKGDNKGVMTVAAPGQFVPTFEAAAHALKLEGDLSSVETEFGNHVLRLVRRSAAGMKTLESVQEEIVAKLLAEFEEGIRTKLFSDFRAASPVFHEDMIEAVRKRYGVLPKIGAQPVVPTAPAADGAK